MPFPLMHNPKCPEISSKTRKGRDEWRFTQVMINPLRVVGVLLHKYAIIHLSYACTSYLSVCVRMLMCACVCMSKHIILRNLHL